jgi:thioredoxin reductase (NADPH)
MDALDRWEVILVGGGLAGLSAAIYLGRALRRTLVIDDDNSLALKEPEVQNYFGFPEGISGEELLRRGRAQARAYGVVLRRDRIERAWAQSGHFQVQGRSGEYSGEALLNHSLRQLRQEQLQSRQTRPEVLD